MSKKRKNKGNKQTPQQPTYNSVIPNVNMQNFTNFSLDMIYNSHILNIFSDASSRYSTRYGPGYADYCYGAVAVCKDDFVDDIYRLQSGVTTPAAEVRGIRLALRLALKHRYEYGTINIFSDSLISVNMIRKHISVYMYSQNYKMQYNYIYQKAEIANKEIFIECMLLVDELRKTTKVNFYYQPGHIDNKLKDIKGGIEKFKRCNGIWGKVDYNLMRYISIYNNFVDNKSRGVVNRSNVVDNVYRDPLVFFAPKN